MKTSNFANNKIYGLNGISIARYPATRQGFKGPEFPPLFPSAQLLAWYKEHRNWQQYTEAYDAQLACLSAGAVYKELLVIADSIDAGGEVILLCYESSKTLDTKPCHRRLVAEWFERELGIVVPEWSKDLHLASGEVAA